MSSIKVKFSVEGEGVDVIKVDRTFTVYEFLDKVREKKYNDDIICAYLKGHKLDDSELLTNYLKNPGTDIIIVSVDDSKGPEDFPDIDVADKDEKGEKINELLTSTKHEVDPEDDTTFKMVNDFKIFTTANERSLKTGDKLKFKLQDNYETISNKIKEMISNWHVPGIPDDFEVQIFLPGGVPFLPGDDPTERTLDDYYEAVGEVYHHRLYVVVTKNLGDQIDEDVAEPCNCIGANKNMLSPLFDSTTAGLTQIASLLGYFFHDGINSEHLMLVFAKITRFAPLVVNMYRLLEHEDLNVRNIVAITGPLFTIFKSVLPTGIKNENVFEYTLKIISFIGLVKETEYLQLKVVDYKDSAADGEDEMCDYLRRTNQQHHIIVWEEDTTNPGFTGFNIDRPREDMYTSGESSIFEAVKTYKPVAPLSLHYIHYPTFVNGDKDNEILLYLNEVGDKKDWIRYIDPKEAKIKESSIDDLARKVHNSDEDDFLSLIDGNVVDQIIVICFDESMSMKWKLAGGNCTHGEPSRAQLATQFLHALVEQSNRLRVSSIYGLICFGNEVKVLRDLTAMSSQFIESLKVIKPGGKTLLYDALKKAQDMIIEAITPETEDEDGEEELQYPNAKYRIIVISDGEDNKSAASPVALANSFIQNGIIVDTVLVSTSEREKNNEMCAISKFTGGLCFRPQDLKEGLKIFEQEAFLNIKMRHCVPPYKGSVTAGILQDEAKKFNKYDKMAENQDLIKANDKIALALPLYMDYLYKHDRKIQTIRFRRLIRELNIIGHNPSENYRVYSSYNSPEEWRIFIKGPEGTPFANKWLNCFMSAPPNFPSAPPTFRFLTIPFHPNISQEGTVVFSLVDKKYTANTGIDSIIEGIVDLLKNPEENSFINSEASTLYKEDKAKFRERQEDEEVGHDDFHDFIGDAKVYDEVPEGEVSPEEERLSQLYVTNVYGKTAGKVLPTPDPDNLYD